MGGQNIADVKGLRSVGIDFNIGHIDSVFFSLLSKKSGIMPESIEVSIHGN